MRTGRPRPVFAGMDAADKPWVLGGIATITVVLTLFSVLLGLAALDVWSGIIVALALLTVSAPLLRWVARREDDPGLFKILYGALVVKFLFSMVRYFVIFVVYGGNGDAGVYHEAGTVFARRLAAGDPIHPIPVISAFPVETHWIADVVGLIYTVTSPSAYSGFLVFSYLCFLGQLLIFRGFRRAVPEADHRRYAILVLFLPSLLFWPSSLGKEALMLFCLGLVSYGAGLLLAPVPRVGGIASFLAGVVGLAFVRPHVALMSVAALGVAFAVGVLVGARDPEGLRSGSTRSRVVRLVALVAVVLVASFATTRFASRFAEDGEPGSNQAQATLTGTTAQTAVGGSEFVPLAVTSPTDVPLGVLSVVFRPLPWEASSVNALIAAGESILMIVLFASSWRRLLSLPRMIARRPFLVFATAFVLTFAVGFSFVANFGILARQRTQMLPFVLMPLALPAASVPSLVARRRASQSAPGEAGTDPTGTGEVCPPVADVVVGRASDTVEGRQILDAGGGQA